MATRVTISLKGSKKLIAELKRRQGATFERAKRVQNNTAKDIITESNQKVPKDSFALVKSARIKEDKSPKKREIRTLGVTYDTDYAVAVHEDLEAKHAPGTSAKFLENPTKKQRRRYASEMKAALIGGTK